MKKTDERKKNKLFIAKIITWIFAILMIFAVLGIAVWTGLTRAVDSVENEKIEKISVPQGSSVKSVAKELKDKKIIRSDLAFYLAARFNFYDHANHFNLKSGVYTVKSSMKLEELYYLLQSGLQEYVSVSIPEGLTISKIGQILEDKDICKKEDFKNACKNPILLEKWHINAENLEGFLFPDTYFLIPGMEAEDVADKMVENFFIRIKEIAGFEGLSFEELYKTVTLASIVEREYRLADEAPVIASVFTNRIKLNMGLYSCATIEYIITELQGKPHPEKITYNDLKIDSPYNTYKWAGLTPGPISNPGKIALDAAKNPAKTDYYFFVLTNPEKGSHTFTETFDEHKAAENLNVIRK